MTEKASRGEPTCPPPFGYVMRDGCYYPDEDSGKADVVREIFRRYADGEGMREIAVSLGERGVKTKGGNKPDKRWISYTLNNPCFIGKIRWSTDGSRAVARLKYDNDSIMTVQGSHEPLIDTDLWERVQARLAQQKKTYAAAKDEIANKIAELTAMRERDNAPQSIDKASYAEKVAGVLEIITDEEIAPEAKNEALRTVVEKIVYNKPEERVEIYFWAN